MATSAGADRKGGEAPRVKLQVQEAFVLHNMH